VRAPGEAQRRRCMEAPPGRGLRSRRRGRLSREAHGRKGNAGSGSWTRTGRRSPMANGRRPRRADSDRSPLRSRTLADRQAKSPEAATSVRAPSPTDPDTRPASADRAQGKPHLSPITGRGSPQGAPPTRPKAASSCLEASAVNRRSGDPPAAHRQVAAEPETGPLAGPLRPAPPGRAAPRSWRRGQSPWHRVSKH
jgi:hypothetical protein